MPPSCALLGGFTIGARIALLAYDNITRNVSEYMLVLALCLVCFCCGVTIEESYRPIVSDGGPDPPTEIDTSDLPKVGCCSL